MSDDENRMVTLVEAGKILGIGPGTVRHYLNEHKMKGAVRGLGHPTQIPLAEVERFKLWRAKRPRGKDGRVKPGPRRSATPRATPSPNGHGGLDDADLLRYARLGALEAALELRDRLAALFRLFPGLNKEYTAACARKAKQA